MITLSPTDYLSGSADAAGEVTYSIFGDKVSGGVDAFSQIAQGQLSNSVTTLVPAVAGEQRLIKSILLTNTGAGVRIVKFYTNGTTSAHRLVTLEIVAGGSASYNDGVGWSLYDSSGTVQSVGATGPIGPTGPPGSDVTYHHVQSAAAAIWTVVHNLGKFPDVQAFNSAGDQLIGQIHHDSSNQLTLTFSAANAGDAYCN
jgi:hypothetical protein